MGIIAGAVAPAGRVIGVVLLAPLAWPALRNPLCHAFCAQRKCQKEEEEEDPSRDSVVKWVRDGRFDSP